MATVSEKFSFLLSIWSQVIASYHGNNQVILLRIMNIHTCVWTFMYVHTWMCVACCMFSACVFARCIFYCLLLDTLINYLIYGVTWFTHSLQLWCGKKKNANDKVRNVKCTWLYQNMVLNGAPFTNLLPVSDIEDQRLY